MVIIPVFQTGDRGSIPLARSIKKWLTKAIFKFYAFINSLQPVYKIFRAVDKIENIEVNIYANKVVFMNFAENNSIMIESKAIADSMRQAYELSWLGAKTIEI